MSPVRVFGLKSTSSDISVAVSVLPWFTFAWNLFMSLFTLCPCVLFKPKGVPHRQHAVGPYFLIHPATQCLLIGEFDPFTCNVTVDR